MPRVVGRTVRSESDPPADDAITTPAGAADPTPDEDLVTPDVIDTNAAAAPTRRPTKFMAELSRAMQTAAISWFVPYCLTYSQMV